MHTLNGVWYHTTVKVLWEITMKLHRLNRVLQEGSVYIYVTQSLKGAKPIRKRLVSVRKDEDGCFTITTTHTESATHETHYKQISRGDTLFVRADRLPNGKMQRFDIRSPRYTVVGINLAAIS